MLVEDDHDVSEAVQDLLLGAGYETLHATDGQEALEKLRLAVALPSVILLDLMMPRMNGWQFLALQREDPRLASIPVVIMSARPEENLPGVRCYLCKPFEPTELLAGVTRATKS